MNAGGGGHSCGGGDGGSGSGGGGGGVVIMLMDSLVLVSNLSKLLYMTHLRVIENFCNLIWYINSEFVKCVFTIYVNRILSSFG
jgi:hypothetical protein